VVKLCNEIKPWAKQDEPVWLSRAEKTKAHAHFSKSSRDGNSV